MQVDTDAFASMYRNPSMELEELFPVDQFFGAYMSQLEKSNPAEGGKLEPPTSSDSSNNLTGRVVGAPTPSPGGLAGYEGFNTSGGPQCVLDDTLQQRSPFSRVSASGGQMLLDQRTFGTETSGGYNAGVACLGGYASGPLVDAPPSHGFGSSEGRLTSGGFTGVNTSAPGQDFTGGVSRRQGGSAGGFVQMDDGLGGALGSDDQFQSASAVLTPDEGPEVKERRSRHRTPRQQMLNKQAQQRYRERKKAKAMELEQAVEQLSNRVDELRTVKKEKHLLEEKAMELERALLEKEAELQRMKSLVKKRSSEMDDSNCSEISTTDIDVEKEVNEFAEQYHSRVSELREFMKRNRIDVDSLDDPNAELDEHLVADVAKMVAGVCNSCMRATRQEGPDVWALITASIDKVHLTAHDRTRWLAIARSMQLSEDQKIRALILRDEHAKKLGPIYSTRQELNLEAIGLLLPSDHGGRGPASDKKLGCFGGTNFLKIASHRSKTSNVLDQLRTNLKDEQKAIAELEYMVFHRILNPIQGAWFTMACYPQHCDCFSLLNATRELCGDLKYGSRELRRGSSSPSEVASKNST